MAEVIIYSKANCPYCVHAKNLLTDKGVSFQELRIDLDPVAFSAMEEIVPRARLRKIFWYQDTGYPVHRCVCVSICVSVCHVGCQGVF